ncbi:hypothetical protein Hypma_004657 [Hypsizygus marmoreus]|uniref:RING-type domain-containing protein n=1 Tax=Hypsizygus marmoreus TaxID=39966 RepID=A0A369J025_HYPMA|nr:hypothetical protein Hypma_004657 [Hypsizygus marmoreus]
MHPCGICIENVEVPVALPCGHIFCNECIRRAVDSIKTYSTLHSCPVCRTLYSVASFDPALVPAFLRPHITPSIRKLYLDLPSGKPRVVSSTIEIAVENARLNAENHALRTNCEMWRRRAEVHGAATLGLLGLARIARDEAVKMRHERDEVYKHYHSLKRKLPDDESSSHLDPPPPSAAADLAPLTHIYKHEMPTSASASKSPCILPPSLSRRPVAQLPPMMPSDATETSRPTKRPRLSTPPQTLAVTPEDLEPSSFTRLSPPTQRTVSPSAGI